MLLRSPDFSALLIETYQTELCKALAGFLFNDEQRALWVESIWFLSLAWC